MQKLTLSVEEDPPLPLYDLEDPPLPFEEDPPLPL